MAAAKAPTVTATTSQSQVWRGRARVGPSGLAARAARTGTSTSTSTRTSTGTSTTTATTRRAGRRIDEYGQQDEKNNEDRKYGDRDNDLAPAPRWLGCFDQFSVPVETFTLGHAAR